MARLEFLQGRCRWPAFWSDEDWNAWCFLLLCGPIAPVAPVIVVPPVIVLVATLVVLNNVFNATLGYVYTPLSTLRFLRPVVPCICFLFSYFFYLRYPGEGPPQDGQDGENLTPKTPVRKALHVYGMHANGKRVRIEMGTGAGSFGDNTKPFFGYIKSSCVADGGSYSVYREGVIPKRAQKVPAKYVQLDTSSAAKAFEPRSRGKASEADKNRIKKKLEMEGDVTVRKLEDEIQLPLSPFLLAFSSPPLAFPLSSSFPPS